MEKKKSRKKLLIVIVFIVLIAVIGVLGAVIYKKTGRSTKAGKGCFRRIGS